jgi:catechol 2,3-dioxygenase-like lactoylglutathione lyase family enzyme
MIHHVSIGASNISASKAFYDAALTPIGYTCLSADDASLGYGKDAAAFWVNRADKPVAADPNSGLHFCFVAPTRKSVESFHKAALAHGGRDNGYRIEAYCSAEA